MHAHALRGETKKQSLTPAEGLNADGCSFLTGLGSGARGMPQVVHALWGTWGGGVWMELQGCVCQRLRWGGGRGGWVSHSSSFLALLAPPEQTSLVAGFHKHVPFSRISSSGGGPSGERRAR